MTLSERRTRFTELHSSGTFVMPNPHDVGSARLLADAGFSALATTSGGLAAAHGQLDMTITREELLVHVEHVAASVTIPLNVDAEQCFPHDPGGVSETVDLLAHAGASGISIEDWNPRDGAIETLEVASARVATAAARARAHNVTLTARAENHIRGVNDLNDTLRRLRAYRDAGAHVVYAPGLVDLEQIERVVNEIALPLNVLLLPAGPTVAQLADVGVRRISVGSLLSMISYGAFVSAATHLRDHGQLPIDGPYLARDVLTRSFV